jgi:ribosomal protein S20
MANLRSSKKKARRDAKLTKANKVYLAKLDVVSKIIKKGADVGSDRLRELVKSIDKAAKRGVISLQKAARLKSALSSKKK